MKVTSIMTRKMITAGMDDSLKKVRALFIKHAALNHVLVMEDHNNGAGILVVTGALDFKGSPNYTGLILVIGEGAVARNSDIGSDEDGIFNGAILVANTT